MGSGLVGTWYPPALRSVDATRRRSAAFSGYANAGDIVIAWGVAWLVCNIACHIDPVRGPLTWIAGIAGAVVWTMVRSRQRSDARVFATVATAMGFVVLIQLVTGTTGQREQSAIIALLVAAMYIGMGIWTGARFAWIGLMLAGVVVAGWFAFPAALYLWLGIGGGGTLIMSGLWLRRA